MSLLLSFLIPPFNEGVLSMLLMFPHAEQTKNTFLLIRQVKRQ